MIRVSGENVAPILVETALLRHPAVEEAAAYGLPGDLGEEVVAAAVVLRNGSRPTMAELRRFVEPDLPYFAIPRYLVALAELPKTQTSKVMKAELQASGITPDHWDGGQPGRQQPSAGST
jgi:crotonobetaine/carnitine-CoA ligase